MNKSVDTTTQKEKSFSNRRAINPIAPHRSAHFSKLSTFALSHVESPETSGGY
jgi:hypothetical protein